MNIKNSLIALAICILLPIAVAGADEGMFPFPIQTFSIGHDATDMSWMNECPAGKNGFVRAKDGHFVDGNGKRIRFLGVNLCNSGAFPEHADAEKLAARLAKLGVNCVRLHHMDGVYAPNGIWNPAFKDHQHMDAVQLDKLDYLIYMLKQHGIYADINLHVSRQFNTDDGFQDTDKLPKYDKGLDNFERRMIELQKEYARQLLTHVNPYTKTRYVDEPAVALIEINNENSLLDDCIDGSVGLLPKYYLSQLRSEWGEWLRVQYKNTNALKKAWQIGSEPLGENILVNSDLSAGTDHWVLEAPAPAQAKMEVVNAGPSDGKCLHARLTQPGTQSWHFQVHQVGLDLVEGKPYTLRFSIRSDRAREINLTMQLDKAPWRSVGLARQLRLTPDWRQYEFTFYASQAEKDHNRLSFNLQSIVGEVWIANVELRRGGGGLPESASLEKGNIGLPIETYTLAQRQDFLSFAADTERIYANDMYEFIKGTLGSKSLVVDTQVSYGGIAGLYRESLLDFGDIHRYWQHPSFQSRPWDPVDWKVSNTPMVKAWGADTLTWMAMHRILGKPFTVSEYNHPAPSDYSAECVPMLASFAAQQDWDGIFLFDYHSSGPWEKDLISNFFQIDSNPSKIVFLPMAAAVFRRADVPPLTQSIEMRLPISLIPGELVRNGTNVAASWENAGRFKRTESMYAKTSVYLTDKGTKSDIYWKGTSSTPAVKWVSEPADKAVYTINSPATRGVIGFAHGRAITLGGLTVEMLGDPGRFGAIAITSLDGKPVESSDHLLICAVGRVENQEMVWNEDRTSVGNQWGKGPAMAEGISAKITLNTGVVKKVEAYALDGGGARSTSVACSLGGDELRMDLGPQWRTLWYEVVLER